MISTGSSLPVERKARAEGQQPALDALGGTGGELDAGIERLDGGRGVAGQRRGEAEARRARRRGPRPRAARAARAAAGASRCRPRHRSSAAPPPRAGPRPPRDPPRASSSTTCAATAATGAPSARSTCAARAWAAVRRARAHPGEHRRAQQRVQIGQRGALAQQPEVGEPIGTVGRGGHLAVGQLRGVPELDVVSEDRHGARDRRDCGRLARQAVEHRARHRGGNELAHAIGRPGVGLQALVGRRAQQLLEQKRIAARDVDAGGHEVIGWLLLESGPHERRHGLAAQAPRPDRSHPRIVGELRDGRGIALLGAVAQRGDDRHRQPPDAPGEVEQEAQRGRIDVLQIVDDEQQRALLGEIADQPVQPVAEGELPLGIGADPVVVLGEAQHRSGQARGALQRSDVEVSHLALEQLAHDAVGKVALHLAAAGAQRRHATARARRRGVLEQPRLADPRRTAQQRGRALVSLRRADHRAQLVALAVALEQPAAGRGRVDQRGRRRRLLVAVPAGGARSLGRSQRDRPLPARGERRRAARSRCRRSTADPIRPRPPAQSPRPAPPRRHDGRPGRGTARLAISVSARGRYGARSSSDTGSSVTRWCRSATVLPSVGNGSPPHSSWSSTAPAAYTSAAGVRSPPVICSGAM